MDAADRSRLRVRMVAAIVTLAALAVGLAVGIWVMATVALVLVDIPRPTLVAAALTAASMLTVAVLEYRRRDRERHRTVSPVDPDDKLHRIATRIARQFDVPVPAVVVVERSAPLAMVVGLRPDGAELHLSRGAIEALDDDELEAVVAHELAHVANRDAWVMTLVTIPVVLADGLADRLRVDGDPRAAILAGPPKAFALSVEWIGRIVAAILGRERERAADLAAARITGSPAVLASALATLDRSVSDRPRADLRSVAGESTLSIVPLEDPTEPVMLGPDGDRMPTLWPVRKRFREWTRSHPPTDDRVATLRAMAADAERQ